MKISNTNKNSNYGFTLTELVVVVAGLATLASLSIPNFLRTIKLNRVEEVKSIMNSHASDCLVQLRIQGNNNQEEFLEKNSPTDFDPVILSNLGYQVANDKRYCDHIAIKPLNEEDEDLFALDFKLLLNPATNRYQVVKEGFPPTPTRFNIPFINSCKGYAGKNCGMSEADKAEAERLAALAKAKADCENAYLQWLGNLESGEFVTWDSASESCTRRVWAFEGRPVSSANAVEEELQRKYGKSCLQWRETKKSANVISPNGSPETKSPDCGGVNYWFHSGREFTNQSDWTEFDNQLKRQSCENDRASAINQNQSGEYTYGPGSSPDPCGKTVWFCNGTEYTSRTDYLSTTCGTPPVEKEEEPERCANFEPHPICDLMPGWKSWHSLCKCQ